VPADSVHGQRKEELSIWKQPPSLSIGYKARISKEVNWQLESINEKKGTSMSHSKELPGNGITTWRVNQAKK